VQPASGFEANSFIGIERIWDITEAVSHRCPICATASAGTNELLPCCRWLTRQPPSLGESVHDVRFAFDVTTPLRTQRAGVVDGSDGRRWSARRRNVMSQSRRGSVLLPPSVRCRSCCFRATCARSNPAPCTAVRDNRGRGRSADRPCRHLWEAITRISVAPSLGPS